MTYVSLTNLRMLALLLAPYTIRLVFELPLVPPHGYIQVAMCIMYQTQNSAS